MSTSQPPSSAVPAATTVSPSGVTFRETMAGPFTLGATDPAIGASSGTALAMHAVVQIDDIARFVTDPEHKAGLSGTLDYPPLGAGLLARKGVFGLFSPSGDPALTYMVYELAFEHAGQPYYLAGKKHVQLGAPWKLWGETTTLYTTLHRGPDASGPVVGAGVLSLGVGALVSLMTTVRGSGSSTGQKLGAIGQFFRYFTVELVRTYVLRRPR